MGEKKNKQEEEAIISTTLFNQKSSVHWEAGFPGEDKPTDNIQTDIATGRLNFRCSQINQNLNQFYSLLRKNDISIKKNLVELAIKYVYPKTKTVSWRFYWTQAADVTPNYIYFVCIIYML